jgi:3-phenylpropionate/cinnamic acid dioxygenase small subunit
MAADSPEVPWRVDTTAPWWAALLELHLQHAHAIDDDRLEDWPGLYTEHALYRITTARNYKAGLPASLIHAQGRAMLADRVLALRQANIYERQRYRHQLGLPLVRVFDEGRAQARSAFSITRTVRGGVPTLFATGLYLDRITFDGVRARFEERIVVCDSDVIDTLLALPL